MKTKTSLMIIMAAATMPAFAEDVTPDIAANTQSANCDSGVLGATSGAVDLEALWSLNDYDCSAGKYFDKTTATCVTCTANSYCPGGTFTVEDLTNGLNACPTGYGLSAAGAGAQTDCYRTCTTSDVAHSTAVSGGYYYTDNNQCSATECAAGWHVKAGLDLANNVLNNPTNSSNAYINSDGFSGVAPGNTNYPISYYGLTDSGTWGVHFEDNGGVSIRGVAKCSAKSGNNYSRNWGGNSADWTATESELTSASGEVTKCWCQVDGYRADGSDEWVSVDASAWVFFNYEYSNASRCAANCARNCADGVQGSSAYRTALFSVIQAQPSICEANIIDLDWNPLNGGAHTQNQCTYDGQITLPTEPSKTGYTFGGWSVVQNSGN